MSETIAVVGLGYVGLPVAISFSRLLPTIGFDINARRIDELKRGIDVTKEASAEQLGESSIRFTDDEQDLAQATFFVVAVPTPIDTSKVPDLRPLVSATRTVAKALKKGDVVVFESTVFPGATEEVCVPELERISGLTWREDFFVGYSPERINPGDKEHTFERITKVVSGDTEATLERVAATYAQVVTAGVHRASSIRVAEAAKVIENTQRDLNIALMNELALIFDRMNVRTKDVIEAASTKWNFLRFEPGLVGGHCIGVDPYYLTSKAKALGYQPEVILAGRRINNYVSRFVAQKTIKLLARTSTPIRSAKIAILGVTFKENVPDLRNSQIPNIVSELREFGVEALVHDPIADPEEAAREHGITLSAWETIDACDALIYAVPHAFYQERHDNIVKKVNPGGALLDLKSRFSGEDDLPCEYWSL